MEAVFRDQDRWALNSFAMAVKPGQFESAFDGFGAGIGNECAVEPADRGQALSQLLLQGQPDDVGSMDQGRGLIGNGFCEARMGVPQTANPYSGNGIQISMPGFINQPRTFTANDIDRHACICIEQVRHD